MQLVIVPSNHVQKCLLSNGQLTTPITIVPESFSDAIVEKTINPSQLFEFETSFNFLIFGQLTGNNPKNDRKNIFNTIRWLCETFKDDKDVGIVIKTNLGTNSKIDRNVVTNMLKPLLLEVRKGKGPKVYLLHGNMNDHEVAALYRHPSIKALVSLTRGEGFGLPILEAAASGLPVVATNWSAHLDYLNLGKFVSIYYQLEEVHNSRIDNAIFIKGSRWANPSEEDFKKRILKFRASSEVPKEWATSLQTKLIESHNFKTICGLYESATKEIFEQ